MLLFTVGGYYQPLQCLLYHLQYVITCTCSAGIKMALSAAFWGFYFVCLCKSEQLLLVPWTILIHIRRECQWSSSFACRDPYLCISFITLESALSHPPPRLYFPPLHNYQKHLINRLLLLPLCIWEWFSTQQGGKYARNLRTVLRKNPENFLFTSTCPFCWEVICLWANGVIIVLRRPS